MSRWQKYTHSLSRKVAHEHRFGLEWRVLIDAAAASSKAAGAAMIRKKSARVS